MRRTRSAWHGSRSSCSATRARQRTWCNLLRISPDAPNPARLTSLPLPASVKDSPVGLLALSPSGTEIAVLSGIVPGVGALTGQEGWLRVYSVATGRLLRAWATPSPKYPEEKMATALTWIHGDSGLALTIWNEAAHPTRILKDIRVMKMTTGDASGNTALAAAAAAGDAYPGAADLFTNSQVTLSLNDIPDTCEGLALTPDGRAVVCTLHRQTADNHTELLWLTYPVSASHTPHVVGRLRISQAPMKSMDPPVPANQLFSAESTVLWTSADGRTMLAGWIIQITGRPYPDKVMTPSTTYFGIASGGRLTLLPRNPVVPYGSIQFGNDTAW
jgi:hypothetical protein